jgi:hypothetical protein
MDRLTLVRSLVLAAVVGFASVATPLAGSAQESAGAVVPASGTPLVEVPAAMVPVADQALRVGPVDAPVGVTRAAVAVDAELHLQNRGRGNRNVRWMWVGGGLILAGAVVGDDVGTILTIGGLVIGLTGLYRYMQ